MRIRAKLTLRNDELISARKKMQLSQIDTAFFAGVPLDFVCKCEKMQFASAQTKYSNRYIEQLSSLLRIEPHKIIPDSLRKVNVRSCFEKSEEVDDTMLLAASELQEEHLFLPSPDENLAEAENLTRIRRAIRDGISRLTWREQLALNLLYGLGENQEYSLSETAQILKITRERTRQISSKSLRKLGLMPRIKKVKEYLKCAEI